MTGGLPSSHMRVAMPAVAIAQPSATSPHAESLEASGHLSHESAAKKKAARYISMQE